MKSSKCLTVFTVLVDNLTPMLPNRYGIYKEPSDSYSSSSQRESLHNDPQKWLQFSSFLRQSEIADCEFEALTQSPHEIPDNVRDFRHNFLERLCDSLPFSPDGSPLMRGIYALSASTIIMSSGGFTGRSVTLRSKADIVVTINNCQRLVQDNHLPAQVVGKHLGASPEQLYDAKLRERIYDTTSSSFVDEVGSFELRTTEIVKDRGGEMSIGIHSESDGAKVSRTQDDFSSCGIWIEGGFIRGSE